MSVVIRGIEMPKSCYECPMPDSEFNYCHAMEDYSHDAEYDKRDCRPSWCPLVEVPDNQWIPVTERLPEVNKYVLGCFKDGSMTAVCLFDRDEQITFWRACTDEGWEADCDSEPTHWMPLPEPPKEVNT